MNIKRNTARESSNDVGHLNQASETQKHLWSNLEELSMERP